MLEEGKKLLLEEKYEEAYEYFKKHYNEYKDIESYYCMINIDFYNFRKKSNQEYYDMYKFLYKKAPKKYLPSFINQLVVLSYGFCDYNFCLKILKEGEKKGCLDGYLHFVYAGVILNMTKNMSEMEYHISKALEDEDADEAVIAGTCELKAVLYAEKYGYEKAMEVIQNMYIRVEHKELIDISELRVIMTLNDVELIREFFQKIKEIRSKEISQQYLNQIIEYFEKQRNYKELAYYVEIVINEFLEFYSSKESTYNYYARMLIEVQEYEKALKMIEKIELNNCDGELYSQVNYTKFLYLIHNHRNKEADELAMKMAEELKNPDWLLSAIDVKIYESSFDEGLKILEKYQKDYPDEYEKDVLNYNYMRIYRYLGNYDLAEKHGNLANEYSERYNLLKHQMYVYKKPLKYQKQFYKFCLSKDDELGWYSLANIYLHGECGVNVDFDKSYEYINKALEKDFNNRCYQSILGNIHLVRKEYDKAFTIFEKQYQTYISGQHCPCSVVFYCYCLAEGIGTMQDKEKAYNILDGLAKDSLDDISENGASLYADLAIKLNKDLNKILNVLNKVFERRYSAAIYLAKIKVKKELNINFKQDLIMFKKSLKYIGTRERAHYQKNIDKIYMNNQ